VPIKVLIKSIDEKQPPSERFIVSELGDSHLFIKPSHADFVQRKVKEYLESLHFDPNTEKK
jgi:hypothetical protein